MNDFRKFLDRKRIYFELMNKHQELEKAGKLLKCYNVLVPILTIEVDIVQTPTESFEEIEKLIMRLIEASVIENKEIEQLTGIPILHIQNIKSLLATQKLLTEDGKNLTESGRLSLKVGEKKITTIEKRKFQVNGITTTIMPKKFQIYPNELLKIEQLENMELYGNPTYEMLDVMEDYAWQEMEENIKQYVETLNEISSSNIQSISMGQILEYSYTYFFLLEFEKLQQPIIVAKSKKYINHEMEFSYEPLWIYKKDAEFLQIEEKEIIGKRKNNMIHFKTRMDHLYKIKEEKVNAFLEKWNAKIMVDEITYEISLRKEEENKDILEQIKSVGVRESNCPIFPADYDGLNGEVFYFYTKDQERWEELKVISDVLSLYKKAIWDKYGNASVENFKKENKDIFEQIANKLPEIPKDTLKKYFEIVKK